MNPMISFDGRGRMAKVVELAFTEGQKVDKTQTHYAVSWKEKHGEERIGIANATEMNRCDFSITIANVRYKIREVATRKKIKYAPWIVKENILREYGVSKELIDRIANFVVEYEERNTRKVKRQQTVFEYFGREPKRRNQHLSLEDFEREEELNRIQLTKEYEANLQKKLPIEDLTLLHLEGACTSCLPEPTTFFLSNRRGILFYEFYEFYFYISGYQSFSFKVYFLDTLMLWRFITFFSRALSLRAVLFEEFINALIHPESDSLIETCDYSIVGFFGIENSQETYNSYMGISSGTILSKSSKSKRVDASETTTNVQQYRSKHNHDIKG